MTTEPITKVAASAGQEELAVGHNSGAWQRCAVVGAVTLTWLVARLVFWIGFAGADDQFYVRYAYLLHRLPINHMEFRIPAVMAIRASLLAFGPSEWAACLPTLLGSAATLAAVAWMVGWPKTLTWQTNGAVLLAALLPIDVTFSTYPGASSLAAAMMAVGTVCILKGNRFAGLAGAALLSLGFLTHFQLFYYVAILCLVCLAVDWRKYLVAVIACVVLSGLLLAVECAAYAFLADDPLFRLRTLSTLQGGVRADYRAGGSNLVFFLMPLEILVFRKEFGFNLVVMLVGCIVAWPKLAATQRILFVSAIGYWFWLGYGTIVPWAYRPASRGMHYYIPLALAVCALTPTALAAIFRGRRRLAIAGLAVLLAVHVACLGLGGNWGQSVDVSRSLLEYANAHPDQRFLTDMPTMNEMYIVGGITLPKNVVCLNTPAVHNDLLVNKEPESQRNFRFDNPERVDALLVNYERVEDRVEPEFQRFAADRRGPSLHQVPKRYRLLLAPLVKWIGEHPQMIRSRGGEVFALK